MIVICIIGIIGSVIGYNMKGSMDEGRAFRSEHGSKQIHDLLTLKIAEGTDIQEVLGEPAMYLEEFLALDESFFPLSNYSFKGGVLNDAFG